MRPRWMRRHVACPECGQCYGIDGEANAKGELDLNQAMPPDFSTNPATYPKGFTCLKCKAHFPVEDFWNEQHEKWDRSMAEPDFKELSKNEFIQRLVSSGWSCESATAEWETIQHDDESGE
jgi:hypothetical protein